MRTTAGSLAHAEKYFCAVQLLLLYKSRAKALQNILFLPSHQRGNYTMKMRLSPLLALATALTAAPVALAVEGGMQEAGRQLFSHHCTACHSLDSSENAFGPSLFGVVDRPAASVPRFAYSKAMETSGITWSEDNLRKWIADNEALVPGTRMRHVAISDPAEQDYLISFLRSLK
jgi:cytochrome c